MPLTPYVVSLLSGAMAGTAVDLSLYPLDTIKTRLQSRGGFFANGGWAGIYRGVGSVILGSAPGAALFFVVYDGVKAYGKVDGATGSTAGRQMMAASMGEIAACAVRVPTEVVKQRAQAGQFPSSMEAFRAVIAKDGFRGLYRGWGITVMREVPFTVIQFPLWEWMKKTEAERIGEPKVGWVKSAIFGSVAGGFAAGVTTPLDVLKTRLMLAKEKQSALTTLRDIVKNEGPATLFSGIGPRCMWISIGGAIFLGAYDMAKGFLEGTETTNADVKESS